MQTNEQPNNENFPKVLIAAPFYEAKHRVVGKWIRSSQNHTYPEKDIYMVDNSPNESYHKKIKQLYNVEVDYISPKGKKTAQIIGESYQKIQKKFHAGNYEYLLIKEIDIQVPRKAIEFLMYHGRQVISIPYFTGQGTNCFMLAWYLVKNEGNSHTNKLLSHEKVFEHWNGKPHITYENGIGCTLIHKSILEKIKFRWDNSGTFTDSLFYRDLFENKIFNYMVTNVIADHDNDDWSRVYRNQIQ